jgi:UDP-glucuronate 4-epimerase
MQNSFSKTGVVMNILITGAAGFIGSHLCERLVKKHNILGLDNFCDFYAPEIKEKNIENLKNHPNFTLFRADIRDFENLRNIFTENSIDMVIHLAAMAGVRPSLKNPQLYTEVNINGTVNLLECCKDFGVKKVLFASSSSVYGNNKKVPFAETDSVDYPISFYAATKKAGELICHTYHHLYQMSIACLRFFTVYGPRQRPDLAIHKFSKLISEGKPIPFYGDGTTCRDYTYIDDIVDGIEKALDFVDKNTVFEIFNLGESKTISLDKMVQTIENCLQQKAKKEMLSMQPGDVLQTYADISKSKKILGYNPQTEFEVGVERFVEWYKYEKRDE